MFWKGDETLVHVAVDNTSRLAVEECAGPVALRRGGSRDAEQVEISMAVTP